MYRIPDLIVKKRDGQVLSKAEVEYFIRGVVDGYVQESQLGAMLMAIFLKGMTSGETTDLTAAMVKSGDTLHWPAEWSGHIVDKHSTGGVGDKISLPLAPALAACGMKVPMISGRGLGHTGGTLDKLEAIPGFKVSCTPERMTEILRDVGCCIVGQTESLVPADRIMYETRDVTGTVASIPLTLGSIVSKKVAENLDALVLDVKFGNAATMKTAEKAKELAEGMVNVCKGLGIKTVALLTKMEDPIGLCIGNSVEVIESIDCLKGKGPDDLMELVCKLGGHLLNRSGHASNPDEGSKRIADVINNGEALKKFCSMMKAQGVDGKTADQLCTKDVDYYSIFTPAKRATELKCEKEGWVQSIDGLELALVSCALGAGRSKAGEAVNHAVGLELRVQKGHRIKQDDVWIKVYHDEPTLCDNYINQLSNALTITDQEVTKESLVRDVID